MRYNVEDKAWDDDNNKGYFVDETGYIDFENRLISYLFAKELARAREKYGQVTVNEEKITGISIRKVGINYDFY